MFWAPVYVGSEHADNYVMYDTMETKIAINAKQALGTSKKSTYSIQESNSSVPIRYTSMENGELIQKHSKDSLHFGGVSSLYGELYNETMCLKRNYHYEQ